jgi:diguanylate cyclase (GGDEF)-like protein
MTDRTAVGNWITPNPAVADYNDSLISAVRQMNEKKIGAILVTKGEELVGIFTERDLLRLISNAQADGLLGPVGRHMTEKPICAQIDEDYNSVYMKMKVHRIRHVPVLKGKRVEGIVSIRDLIHFCQNELEAELLNVRGELKELKDLSVLSTEKRIETLRSEIEKYRSLSLTDDLTGLYNKRYFEARLREEINRANRYDMKLSLIFADIDHFKRVNDNYGHDSGDEVLRRTAGVLSGEMDDLTVISRLRKSDIVARYGGEEFVIILPETPLKGAVAAAEKLRKVIESHSFRLNREEIRLTMSFGVASYAHGAPNGDTLIKNADLAMYRAKQEGRNKVETYEQASA